MQNGNLALISGRDGVETSGLVGMPRLTHDTELASRLIQHLGSRDGAATTVAGATGLTRQLTHGAHTTVYGVADIGVGNGFTAADVHRNLLNNHTRREV